MKICLQIERIVLDGLPVTSAQAPLVQQAIEEELARLLESRGLSREFQAGAALPRVRAGTVTFGKENQPGDLGQGIARAIHEGIGGRRKPGGRS